ncbi:ankyrin unc44 [Colletotrichum karsti]|uniref:Ankyrin unc44 n=1 Tax=Colletotrichum karsti TaxID=1095194 RepID=A0A9P6LK87_9PEZI|nr:ankyrin unc44 [Colletotrichum karsti]KAF9875775.1 ankyrin unc44 [Colletotrichum karsti]
MLHYHYDIEGSDDSNADIFNRGGIDREAQKLLDAVLAKRTERDKKDSRAPIVFVSHDIGGTIVKKALVIAALNPAKYDDVFGNTTVLSLIGHSENPVKFVVLTEGRDERLETRLSSLSHSINLADFDNFSAAEVLAKSEIKDTEIVDKHVKWLLINKPALASFADKITDLLGTCGSDFGLAQTLVSYAVKYWKEHYRLAGSYKPKEQALHFFENPSLRNLWQQALWVLSNPITRVSKSYLSALPVASITGLTDLVAQHVEAQRGSPTFPVDVDLALVEAAYGEHTAVAQALLDATVHTHGGLSDAILAAAATGNEITLGCLIMAAVRLRGFSWPLGLFQGVALLGLFDTAKLLLTHNIPIPPPGDSYETSILHLAVRGGNAQVVKLLIDAGSNVDAGVVNGESVNTTPLHQASRHGNVDVIQILLAAGANIEARDTYQNTPLIWAVRTGMIQATETLLAAGADVDPWKIEPEKAEPIITSSREPDSPLIWAAEFGHTECARLLLDKGADVKVKKGGRSALWFATLNGHVEICRHLLEKGADVNESSEQYGTLIVELMDQADLDAGKAMDILRLLVKYGANVNAIDAYMDCRRNALSRATVANRKELIEVLLENGAQPDLGAYADCGVLPELGTDVAQTGLYTAVYHGYNEIAKILIERGCNIHLTGQDKASSLHAAYNNPELADFLLEKGADVNGVSNSGTVTHLAIRYSQKDVLKVLLKWKPNLEIEDYGMTALCLACQKRDSEMIELLLEHGANINHRTPDDEYPLKLCCQSNSADAVATILSFRPDLTMTDQGRNSILHDIDQFSPSVDIYKMLLGAGFDINAQNADGETPAMKAAEKGVMGILKLLLARGADTSLSSATHESLLHVAASTGNWEIFKAIIDAGATVHLTKPEGVRETLVYKAASGYRSSDRLQMIQYLIEEAKMPPDEHCPRTQFEYPLHAAASFGNDEIVEYLVEKGADLDASDIMGRTVLHIAAKQCGAGVVDLLLSKGAEPLKQTNIDMIPLHFAAAHEYRPEGLETLVQKLGEPRVQSQDDQNSAEGKEPQMVAENQQASVDINFKDRDGWTALMWAAKTKYLNFDILELLFSYGADPWVQSEENWTPLKIFRFHEPMIGTSEQLEPKEKTRTRPDGTIEEWDDEIQQIEPGDYQPGYQCSYCMTYICGKRWHCLDCSFSYDLCFKCISSKDSLHTHVYSGHTFEAIGIELYVGPDESPERDEGLETVGEEDEKRSSDDDLLQGDGETDDISKILQLDDENNTDSDGD